MTQQIGTGQGSLQTGMCIYLTLPCIILQINLHKKVSTADLAHESKVVAGPLIQRRRRGVEVIRAPSQHSNLRNMM